MKLINSEQSYARAPAKPIRLGSVDRMGHLFLFLDQSAAERLFCEKSRF
jgi:hypothetical protein